MLEYQNNRKAIIDHVDEADKMSLGQFRESNPNRNSGLLLKLHPQTQFINESGLYSLILSCKLPKAKQFKRWVTSEVLPTIRKTGKYDITKIETISLESSMDLKKLEEMFDLVSKLRISELDKEKLIKYINIKYFVENEMVYQKIKSVQDHLNRIYKLPLTTLMIEKLITKTLNFVNEINILVNETSNYDSDGDDYDETARWIGKYN